MIKRRNFGLSDSKSMHYLRPETDPDNTADFVFFLFAYKVIRDFGEFSDINDEKSDIQGFPCPEPDRKPDPIPEGSSGHYKRIVFIIPWFIDIHVVIPEKGKPGGSFPEGDILAQKKKSGFRKFFFGNIFC